MLEYHCFVALIREVVQSKIDDPRGKLTRLIKHTASNAKELIKHCIQVPQVLIQFYLMGEDAPLTLVGHPSSDGVTRKIPYG